ncbi:hypothetical protein CLOP_g1312, partial [Closterium sp. NIES-67]
MAAAAAAAMSHCHRRRPLCDSRLSLLAVLLVVLAVAGVTTAVRLPTSTNPCDSDPCGPNATECTGLGASSWNCTCAAGTELVGAQEGQPYCMSPGNCDDGTRDGPCGVWGECTETATGYNCTCDPTAILVSPFKNGSQTCILDPCDSHPCGPNATSCTPAGFSYNCTCAAGAVLVGVQEDSQFCKPP